MPIGFKGEKRPADLINAAMEVMHVATGKKQETPSSDDGKNPAAVSVGRKGEAARAATTTPERRAEVARKALAKW